MERIKQITKYSIYVLLTWFFISCGNNIKKKYPRYSATTKRVIPDSLKSEYRRWITETVKAASQNMSGGDYENVDETILQAERTANRVFGDDVRAIRIEMDGNHYHDLIISEYELNKHQKIKFDSLFNNQINK